MLLPAAVTNVRRITASYHSICSRIRYNNVALACMGLQSLRKIAFFPRLEVGQWLWDIGGTVGALQQQLGFLFS